MAGVTETELALLMGALLKAPGAEASAPMCAPVGQQAGKGIATPTEATKLASAM